MRPIRDIQVRDARTSELIYEGPLPAAVKLAEEVGIDDVLFDGVSEGFDPAAVSDSFEDYATMMEASASVQAENPDVEPDAIQQLEKQLQAFRGKMSPQTADVDRAKKLMSEARRRRSDHPGDVTDKPQVPAPTPPDLATETGILRALAQGDIDEVEFLDRRNEMVKDERIRQGRDPQTGIPFHELAARLGLTEEEVQERLSQQA